MKYIHKKLTFYHLTNIVYTILSYKKISVTYIEISYN